MVAFASPVFRSNSFPLAGFVSRKQESRLRALMQGAAGKGYSDRIETIARRIAEMPATYQTKGTPDPVCWLHYSVGKAHIYIIEKDAGATGDDEDDFQTQAFGLSSLFGDGVFEAGYVSIPEITAAGAELDLAFEPVPRSVIQRTKRES